MADLEKDPPIAARHTGTTEAVPTDKYLALQVHALLAAPNLDGNSMAAYITARRGHNLRELELSMGGSKIEILGQLGSGGSKEVYKAGIGSYQYALALPNTVDGAGVAVGKWAKALKEPANTAKLRKVGVLANPHSEVINVKFGATELPGIVMDTYDQLPFQVRDSKNRTNVKDSFLMETELDGEKFLHLFQKVAERIRKLLDIGAHLGRDCFNICITEDNTIDLYFNDLGAAEFKEFEPGKRKEYAEEYLSYAIGAFINGLTESEYQKHKDFCSMIDYSEESDAIRARLIEQILSA